MSEGGVIVAAKRSSRNWSDVVNWIFRCCLAVPVATALLSCALPASSLAQTPNFSGVWNRYPAMPPTFSGLPDPPEWDLGDPPLREPYRSEWKTLQERRAAAEQAGKPLPDDSALCRPDGTPMIMWAHYALQILQNPELKQITILAEFMAQTRRIYLDEDLPPVDSINPSYSGYSVAKWKGDVLEVTTAGVREDTRFNDIPHSSEMVVKERLFLDNRNFLIDEVTIEDPRYLIKPYQFKFMYKKEAPSYKITEFVCDNQRTVVQSDGTLGLDVESDPDRGAQTRKRR